jgi:putative transposase
VISPPGELPFRRLQINVTDFRQAAWHFFRYSLSLRDVEETLAERGIDASDEAIRGWTRKFGKAFGYNLRATRAKSTDRWNLDGMVVMIAGKRLWLWRAINGEGDAHSKAPKHLRSVDVVAEIA